MQFHSNKYLYSNQACIVKGKLTKAIMWLRDTGILDKVKYDVLNPPIPIPDPTVRRNQPLTLKQLGMITIILVVGLVIGTIVFFVELYLGLNNQKLQSTDAEGIQVEEIELNDRWR